MPLRPVPWRVLSLLLSPALLAAGCTSVLGIDGEYVEQASAGGRKPVAGKGGTAGSGMGGTAGQSGSGNAGDGGKGGGVGETGGTPGDGGGTGTGGIQFDAGPCAAPCASDEKCCYGICQKVGPGNGCTPDSCAPCPTLPDNAVGKCTATSCDFDCVNNTVRNGDVCEASTTGTGGGQGTGGATSKCVASQCPMCPGDPIYKACCQQNNTCGCAFPFAPCFQ